TLTVNPTTLGPGNGTVTSTLTVSQTGLNSGAFSLVGSLPVTGGGFGVAPNGNIAYLCGQNEISIINVANPASPQLLSSFGSADLGGAGGTCQLFQGNKLVEKTNVFGFNHSLTTYDITNPTTPTKIGGPVVVNPPSAQPAIYDLVFNGNTAYFSTDW